MMHDGFRCICSLHAFGSVIRVSAGVVLAHWRDTALETIQEASIQFTFELCTWTSTWPFCMCFVLSLGMMEVLVRQSV